MAIVLLKLFLAPSLVGVASLAGHRFGQRVTGLVAALPIVGGPLLAFYAYDHGPGFVARAAAQALSGVFSLSAYCVVYAWLACAQRKAWTRAAACALTISWGVFVVCTALLAGWAPGKVVSALFAAAGLLLGARSLPSPHVPDSNAESPRPEAHPGFRGMPFAIELVVRMGATAALVLTLTAAAGALGPDLSGLLTPFPVASSVLLVAAHIVHGPFAALRLLRGFLAGMWGFVFFCMAVTWAAVPLGSRAAFGLGLLGVVVVQLGLAFLSSGERRGALDRPATS